MQNCVIVLLKLLLATVTAPGTNNNLVGLPPGLTSPIQELPPREDAPPPTREEVDVARHKEITSKAVSAIILTVLKWFKASREWRPSPLADLKIFSNSTTLPNSCSTQTVFSWCSKCLVCPTSPITSRPRMSVRIGSGSMSRASSNNKLLPILSSQLFKDASST